MKPTYRLFHYFQPPVIGQAYSQQIEIFGQEVESGAVERGLDSKAENFENFENFEKIESIDIGEIPEAEPSGDYVEVIQKISKEFG